MATYASDDWLNVIEDHLTRALQDDADLGTDGDLEITTWDQELRHDAASYMDTELPACITQCKLPVNGSMVGVDQLRIGFPIQVWFALSAADEQRRQKLAKEYLARGLRVLLQQHVPGKLLKSLPANMDFATNSTIEIDINSGDFESGEVEGVTRAVVQIDATLWIILTIGAGD